MKKSSYVLISFALIFLSGFIRFVPIAHAEAINETATETWDAADCIGAVNGAQTNYFGAADGDKITLNVTNDSTETLSLTITGSGYTTTTVNNLGPGQSYGNTYTDTNYIEVFATATSCTAKADDSYFYAEAASGSLACNTSDSGKVWNITGNYTNVVPTVYLYRGITYVADLNSSSSNIDIDELFSAMSTSQTYYLYNGTSSSDRLIGQATCPAYMASGSSSSQSGSSAPKATSPAKTTTASPQTTPTTSPNSTSSNTQYSSTPNTSNTSTIGSYNQTSWSKKWSKYFAIYLVILGILTILLISSTWMVFKKAGKPGWAAIIPIYSTWVIYEIGGKPGWWAILMLIPVVNIVALIMYIFALVEISRKFSKGALFAVLGLFFFWFIGWPILGFSKKNTFNDQDLNQAAPVDPYINQQ